MRNVLSIAITEMTYRPASNQTIYDDTCKDEDLDFGSEREGFKWSESLQGVILGAFYWGM